MNKPKIVRKLQFLIIFSALILLIQGEGRLQSGEMSNAGGALPWSIQQRSHTPPDPLMLVLTPEQPKDLSASLEDILASLSYILFRPVLYQLYLFGVIRYSV